MRISSPIGNDLETLFGVGVVGRLSDAELLARFLRTEDLASSEAAFAALVERHGPMVLGVCRRMLGDYHAAADAFQAVFLVLAGKASRVRVDDTLARWLHGVSVRVSLQARAVARAERARVRSLEGLDPIDASAPADPEGRRELRAAIDEEIARLPARYRSAVVLCYLEGLTPEQAARRLRCPVGTVQSRLHRARERLRRALSRRGLAPSAWVPTALTDMSARADVPPALAASAVPAAVVLLARSTMRSLSMSRILRVAWILLAVGVSASGAAILAGVGDDRGANRPAPGGRAARADTAAERPNPAPAADGPLEIRAVAAATGKPLEGASVSWRLWINHGKHQDTKSTTNGDGLAVLNWPGGATVNGLEVTVRKAGFVSYFINWKDSAHPLHLPAFKEIRLATGIAIGGVVTDESGTPVAGARIEVLAPPNETEESNYGFTVAEATTDATGRWRVDHAPASPAGVSVKIWAPRFLDTGGPPSRNLDAVTILKRGVTIKGRVLDARRQPIAGANVRGGDEWTALPAKVKTDAGGAFVLENLEPGASVVTVQAEGFAPDLREVHPEDQPALEFLLGPGHTVRGQVVDRNGKPVAGATISPETWRAHRTLEFRADTGPDGRFEWRSAPGDVVLFSISKSGYISRAGVALPAAEGIQVIALDPELILSGRVTDAASGRPVAAFRLIRGLVFANNPRPHWMVQEAATFTGGRYTTKFDGAYAGYAVRIEANGYKPTDSRIFRPGEVAPTFDFAMARAGAADLLTGVVLRPDGRPAAGAQVALVTPEHPLLFEREWTAFSRGNGMSVAKTGPDGRFAFDKPGGAYLLAAMSDEGYGEATSEGSGEPATLALQAWGKIKGRARIGHRPAAHQPVAFGRRGVTPGGPRGVYGFYQREARTDAQGNFSFDRVIPGAGEVSRVVVTELGDGGSQHMGCWQEPIDVAPGQTLLVHLGGRGRPVVGRIVLRAAAGAHVDWRQNRPATLEKDRSSDSVPDPNPLVRYAANLDKDGRFRIDDVPPGRYELTVTIDPPAVPDRPGPVQEIGRVKVPVEVVQGPDDVLVELGEIKAEVPDRSKK